MSRKYLGDVFDIHTGGVDHIPIHHENEIAQSLGATGKIPARIWMHVEFLQINGGKMSKSLHNVYTISDLEEKGIEPLAYRYFTFTAHYRTKLNFTWDAIKTAQVSLDRLRELTRKHKEGKAKIDKEKIEEYRKRFTDAINDDINMPNVLAVMWDIAREKEKSKDYYDLLMEIDGITSLDLDKIKEEKVVIPDNIQELLNQREKARSVKDFALSDKLRDEINNNGYIVLDTKEGQIIKKKE